MKNSFDGPAHKAIQNSGHSHTYVSCHGYVRTSVGLAHHSNNSYLKKKVYTLFSNRKSHGLLKLHKQAQHRAATDLSKRKKDGIQYHGPYCQQQSPKMGFLLFPSFQSGKNTQI